MNDQHMTVSLKVVEGVSVMELAGRLDEGTSPMLSEHLETAFASDTQHLILDLSGLSYLSSAGLRVLIIGTRRMQTAQRRLVLVDVPNLVYMVFDVSGLSKIFAFAPNIDEALSIIGPER